MWVTRSSFIAGGNERLQRTAQMSINMQTDKQIVVHTQKKRISEKELTTGISSNMDEPQKCYAE